jgi:hypothetical protein
LACRAIIRAELFARAELFYLAARAAVTEITVMDASFIAVNLSGIIVAGLILLAGFAH